MKRAFLALLAIVLVAAAVAGVWVLRARRGPAPLTGEVEARGLGAPVEVVWDSLGVPHIWARSEADALFAQGFVHAQDRLWQMELFRRTARGRLSEAFGEVALEADRFLRTLGLSRAAERTLETLPPETLALLEAYVRGVNAGMELERGARPPELALLGIRPEPWTLTDVLSIEKVMAWDLADYDPGLELARVRATRGPAAVEALRPRYPDWGITIVGGAPLPQVEAGIPGGGGGTAPDGVREGEGGAVAGGEALPPALLAAAEPPELAATLLEAASVARASNSWVVGPSRSRSGRPLLANDMHLGLNAPTLWYLAALHAPGLDVVGMTLPGSAGVVAGHTRGVAWGFTNAALDDADFFVERVAEDTTRYLTPDGTEAFRVRDEVIAVRGWDEPVALRVRETRHGPVMTPVESRAGGELLALRWVAHDPSSTATALLAMNRAGSVEELLEGLRDFRNPHQNVVFADTAGRFGYWMAGRVPLRKSGRPTLLPVPGWTGDHDWTGWLPFEDHPHVLDPPAGFVATANNRQTPDSLAELVSTGTWAPPYRAMRIAERIAERPLHDAASLADIQLDVRSAFALRYLSRAVESFRRIGLPEEARSLEEWSGEATLESREATLFHLWLEGVESGLRRRFHGRPAGYLSVRAVEDYLDGEDPEIADEAAREAASAEVLPWGEVHRLDLSHPLEDVPVIGWLFGFGVSGIPREGAPHTVNVAGYSGSRPPFSVRWGPSQRHVVDLADIDGPGGFVLPGGQSGRPRGAHSWDQLELWRRGELWRLPLDRERLELRVVGRLRLVPATPSP